MAQYTKGQEAPQPRRKDPMSGCNTKLGRLNTATTAPRFQAGRCDVHEDGGEDGAAVFDMIDGMPFVLIGDGLCVGNDAMPRAQALARLLNGVGWGAIALLAEVAQLLRGYEAHHRAKFPLWTPGSTGDGAEAHAKAERNGQFAARIERWLAGEDMMPDHPVEALRDIAGQIADQVGLQVDHEAFDQARAYTDQLVREPPCPTEPKFCAQCGAPESEAIANPPADAIGQVGGNCPSCGAGHFGGVRIRRPIAEGLEAAPYTEGTSL